VKWGLVRKKSAQPSENGDSEGKGIHKAPVMEVGGLIRENQPYFLKQTSKQGGRNDPGPSKAVGV